MTYVLGVRCANGVVLVADRKLTTNNGASFEFIDKIHGDIRGVLWACSGDWGTFELFRCYIRDRSVVQTNPHITSDRFIIKLSEVTRQLFENYKYYYGQYEVLVAISGTKTVDGRSALKLIFENGKIEPVNLFQAIGGGAPYGLVYLKEFFNKNSITTMNQAAELGHFIIKYIEKYQLDNTVGLGSECVNKYPQIHFIPDNEPDYPATSQLLEQMEETTKNKLEKMTII
jgi:20S proteasome alpha/beta subunit